MSSIWKTPAIVGGAIAAAVVVCSIFSTPVMAQKSDVTLKVGIFGGTFAAGFKKYTADHFTQTTGITVSMTFGNPSDFVAQMIASRGREPPYDVVVMDDAIHATAYTAGVLDKLDVTSVPNLKFIYPEARFKDDVGAGVTFFSIGIAYNKDKLKAAGIPEPTSWNDLWDPRFAGHISLPDMGTIMGRAMLVQIAKMNGGNESTVKDIIPKIAQIRVQSYYNSSSTAQALIQSGDAWITVWNSLRAGVLIEKGLPIGYIEPKEGGIASLDYVSLVKGSRHKKEALMLINEFLSPMGLLGLNYEIPGAPPSLLLTPVIEGAYPSWKRRGPMTPDDLKKLYQPNWILFDKDLPSIVATWNRAVNK